MKLSALKDFKHGFTLIELLVVITIIAALAVAVFVALNPAERLLDARNARRVSDVDSILSAIHQSIVDNAGSYPTNMPAATVVTQLGTAGSGCATVGAGSTACGTAAACADLQSGAINTSAYLKSMPIDPLLATSSTETGYSVVRDANGIVTVTACLAEGGSTISASR